MEGKVIEKSSKGTITSEEDIQFNVYNPQGGHRQSYHKKVYAEDELRRNR